MMGMSGTPQYVLDELERMDHAQELSGLEDSQLVKLVDAYRFAVNKCPLDKERSLAAADVLNDRHGKGYLMNHFGMREPATLWEKVCTKWTGKYPLIEGSQRGPYR